MTPKAFFASVIAGLLAAAAWGLLTSITGIQFVYAAWIVGGMIGFMAVAAGAKVRKAA